jgi:NAD(P)H dehydrogenase (quinone)
MNILILLAHPSVTSFNHSIAQACRNQLLANGHTVMYHDLYAEKFNPLINQDEIPTTI